jgi:hypothetical protein
MDTQSQFTPGEKLRGEKMFDLLEKMGDAAEAGNIAGMDAAVSVLEKPSLEALLLIAASCLDLDRLQECRRLLFGPAGGGQ